MGILEDIKKWDDIMDQNTISNMTPNMKMYMKIKELRNTLQEDAQECDKYINERKEAIRKYEDDILKLVERRNSLNRFDNQLREIMSTYNESTTYVNPSSIGSDSITIRNNEEVRVNGNQD